jgi:hypothetical protein
MLPDRNERTRLSRIVGYALLVEPAAMGVALMCARDPLAFAVGLALLIGYASELAAHHLVGRISALYIPVVTIGLVAGAIGATIYGPTGLSIPIALIIGATACALSTELLSDDHRPADVFPSAAASQTLKIAP